MHLLDEHVNASANMNQAALDQQYMSEALRLAKKGIFTTQPNPRVGCVLVKEGKIIGQGWHRKAGEPHAEVHAIRQAGALAKGACAYVTLEPCSHFGKTPPCAEALIKAEVTRVVIAVQDPNSSVAGRGIAKLEAHGIEVVTNVLVDQAKALNKGFMKRMVSGLPWLTIKMAMSVDGRTAMASGESQWITGPQARSDVQRIRAESSAVITGIGTLLHDNAALTVRSEQFDVERFSDILTCAENETSDKSSDGISLNELIENQPLRVVLDSQARMPLSSRLLDTKSPVLWVVSEDVSFDATQLSISALSFVDVLVLPTLETSDALRQILIHLGSMGCNEVLVEAGASLAGSFMKASLCDELVVYMAPKLLGSRARPLLELPNDHMADATDLVLKDIRQFGDDLRLTYQAAIASESSV